MDDVWKPPLYESRQSASAQYVRPRPPAAGSAGGRVLLVVALGVAVAGVVLAVVSLLVTGGEAAGYRTWHQQGGAMEPTYPEGSDVTVKSIDGSGVRRGDVVLFSARDWGADSVFMMRVIALGGDQVVIDQPGRVKVNGKILRESYLFKSDPYFAVPVEVTVPEGRLFLLGDHRVAARDSRAYLYENSGTIARSAVVGVAVDHASAPSPDRLWTWVGAGTAAVGLVAAAVTATIMRRTRFRTPNKVGGSSVNAA